MLKHATSLSSPTRSGQASRFAAERHDPPGAQETPSPATPATASQERRNPPASAVRLPASRCRSRIRNSGCAPCGLSPPERGGVAASETGICAFPGPGHGSALATAPLRRARFRDQIYARTCSPAPPGARCSTRTRRSSATRPWCAFRRPRSTRIRQHARMRGQKSGTFHFAIHPLPFLGGLGALFTG